MLESGTPTDRQLEKRLKDWLIKSHKELDRTIKFEQLCSHAVQVWQLLAGWMDGWCAACSMRSCSLPQHCAMLQHETFSAGAPLQHPSLPDRLSVPTTSTPTACPVHRRTHPPVKQQVNVRSQLGQDVTVFERIFDGLQRISKGDVVRLNTKPAMLGRVSHRVLSA